jgi:quercetin dioxygenase-like cupin family protein
MSPADRLREHPEDRLASPVQAVDLTAVTARLRSEAHPAVSGHRQITLVRRGPVTVILFLFEPQGLLKEHRADGDVIIHVLSGQLQVTVDEEARELGASALLALAPGVPHSLRALVATEMLLTIHRRPVEAGAG